MQLAHYLGLLHRSAAELAAAYREVAAGHADEVDVARMAEKLAKDADGFAEELQPFVARYGELTDDDEPARLHAELFAGTRSGPLGLLRDLHDLYLMATELDLAWTLVAQAAQALRDEELLDVVQRAEQQTAVQLKWIKTRSKVAAPQTLVVA